jgi:hypothetical protein
LDALIYGNAGAIASLISTFIFYPLENIKTRMQTRFILFLTIKKYYIFILSSLEGL